MDAIILNQTSDVVEVSAVDSSSDIYATVITNVSTSALLKNETDRSERQELLSQNDEYLSGMKCLNDFDRKCSTYDKVQFSTCNKVDSKLVNCSSSILEQDAIKTEHVIAFQTTDDESMAVEALRQLGGMYTNVISTEQNLPLLSCSTCDAEFQTTADLQVHSVTCRSQFFRKYSCAFCSDSFETEAELNTHNCPSQTIQEHLCRLCNQHFPSQKVLQEHVNSNHCSETYVFRESFSETLTEFSMSNNSECIAEDFLCRFCSENFSLQEDLKNHVNSVHSDQCLYQKYFCGFCNELFKSETEIISHNCFPGTVQRKYCCRFCNQFCSSQEDLQNHLSSVHTSDQSYLEQKFCGFCNEFFKNLTEFHTHNCSQNSPKTYLCRFCNREFSVPEQLQEHENSTHNTEVSVYRKYFCTFCEEFLKNEAELSTHSCSSQVKFLCKFCNQRFSSEEVLREHENSTHNSELSCVFRKYFCSFCKEFFKNEAELSSHNCSSQTGQENLCRFCNQEFSNKEMLQEHINLSHNSDLSLYQKYICTFCEKIFKNQSELNTHICSTQLRLLCKFCNHEFPSQEALKEHESFGHSSEISCIYLKYVCTLCKEFFKNQSELCSHSCSSQVALQRRSLSAQGGNSGTRKGYHCPICNQIYPTKEVLQEHLASAHNSRSYLCILCNEFFKDSKDLSSHNCACRTAQGRFLCRFCNRHFSVRESLKDHISSKHSRDLFRSPAAGEKYHCRFCLRRFSTQETLNEHINAIHNSRRFFCNLCQEFFKTQAELSSHSCPSPNSSHDSSQTSQGRFLCRFCSRHFSTQESLQEHVISTHSNSYKKCLICNEPFNSDAELHAHSCAQVLERYVCRFCSQKFPTQDTLQKHIASNHNNDKPYVCHVCKKQFPRPSSLTNHLKIHNYQPGRALLHSCFIKEPSTSTPELQAWSADLLGAEAPDSIPVDPLSTWGYNYVDNLDVGSLQVAAEELVVTEVSPSGLENPLPCHSDSENRADHHLNNRPINQPDNQLSNQLKTMLQSEDPKYFPTTKELNPRPVKVEIMPFGQEINKIEEPFPVGSIPQMEVVITEDKGAYKCSHCDASFDKEKLLKSHMEEANHQIPLVPFEVEEAFPVGGVPQMEVVFEGNCKKPYRCSQCGTNFSREKALKSHLRLHMLTWPSTFDCEFCGETFPEEPLLLQHKKSCISADTLYCPTNSLDSSLKRPEIKQEKPARKPLTSLRPHVKVGKHPCPDCGKHFATKQKMFRHMWIHRKKTYTCELCALSFDLQQDLDRHRLAQHPAESPYVCQECGKCFASRQGLWEHGRVHGGGGASLFTCTKCGKKFASRQGFLIHNRTHTGERPYGCRFCLKAFRDGGTLRKHERIHTGERPHVCPICLHDFNQKVVLREHVRWVHAANKSETEDGFFLCQICDKKVGDREELCAHIVRHSDQMAQEAKDSNRKTGRAKPNGIVKIEKNPPSVKRQENPTFSAEVGSTVECDLCGKKFASQKDLMTHVHIHI